MTLDTSGQIVGDGNTVAAAPLPDHSADRAAMVAAAKQWGYWTGAIKTRRDLWVGRRVLDVGMGAGPHSLSFIEGGAQAYVGVDPLVGTDHVRDFRNLADPTIPAYHAFPYDAAAIMRAYPNIHLYSSFLEDVSDEIKTHKVDIAMMAAVTEHLTRPEEVIKSIWELLDRNGYLWISHCNYYSWTGHHRPPRSVAEWKQGDPAHDACIDWKHLDPAHPDYSNPNFNRVRLEDLRLIIAKYFEIVEWKVSVMALQRLTPEIRARWKKYSLDELLGQNIYITGRRRDVPLDIDLSDRQFHHPAESYLANRDYLHESLDSKNLTNSVFFSPNQELHSHSDNDSAGLRFFATLKSGDKVTVSKFIHRLNLTVAEITHPKGSTPRVRFVESIPPELTVGNHDQWTLDR